MAMYKLLVISLLYLSIIYLQPAVSEDEVVFLQQFCSEEYYDQGTVFQSNLNLLLSNLSREAVTNKFYNSTVGEGVDKVYGLYLCNGAYTDQLCQDCITVAAGQVRQKCPHDIEAIVFYGQCLLRYSNRSIFAIEDVSVYFNFDYGPMVYKQYDQQLSSMLINLFNKAIVDNTSLTFATGVVYVTATIALASYVDCTPDLTPDDCRNCLQVGLSRLPLNGRQLGNTVQPSCRLSYFYIDVSPGKRFSVLHISLIAVAAAAGISFTLNFYLYFRKSKSMGKPNGLEEIESMDNLHIKFSVIKVATDHFSSTNKIGQGGFGVVYMGTLPDGQAIAVKRLASSSGQGIKEFKSEASLAAKLQHKNLVKVYGFCLEGEEKLIVYEFLPNKSLDRFLFDTKRGVHLKWETRQKILIGIARGLLYLHEDSRFRIIHRDLKPSNILLDGEMNPKIADFGMAKLFEADQTQGNTSRVAGTFGYMAPEYVSTGNFSVKSDVFSFGVILLEILSGRKNNVSELREEDENLVNHAWRLWNDGAALTLVDPNLGGNYLASEVTRYIHIGLLCVQEDAAKRPTMALILSMLSSESVLLPLLTAPPAFPYRSSVPQALGESNALFTEEVFTNVHG
ncbi:putative cysteine-rich receptor-like protein kinase 20, partial [Bienertia sinuspersici]